LAILNPLDEIHFCLRCGAPLVQAERFGKVRPVCPVCRWVYFADPKVAAAALVEHAGRVLLVRRANDPLRGLRTLPAGFVDAGEDPAEAAARECLEETGLAVCIRGLVDVLAGQEHPRGAHILIVYRAMLAGEIPPDGPHPADDVDGAGFFAYDALPPLAFKTTQRLLKQTGAFFR